MKKIFLILILFLVGCGGNNKEKVSNNVVNSKILIIPAYFYDLNKWDKIAKIEAKEVVIVNPSNGPGSEIDDNYVNFIDELNSYKKIPIGYVYTKWANRDIDEVKQDIDAWLDFYPKIKGFFFDEVNTSKEAFDYYKDLSNYVKSKGDYKIVLNPGTNIDESYFSIADFIVVFEGDFKNFNNQLCKNLSDKKGAIFYNVSKETFLRNYQKIDCKYLYFTDVKYPYYQDLPSFFDEEVKVFNK